MTCRLCLKESDSINCLNIFDEIRENLNIASIIKKHFWFEPQFNISENDTNMICKKCWNILENFHNFYKEIKEAHDKLQLQNSDNKLQLINLKTEKYTILEDQNDFYNDEYDSPIHLKNDDLIDFKEQIDNNLMNEEEQIDNDVIKENIVNRKSIRLKCKNNKTNDIKKMIKNNKKLEHQQKKDINITIIDKSKIKNEEKLNLLKNNLEIEDKFVSNYMKLLCSICSNEFATFTELKRHFKLEHNEDGFAVCCEKKFYKRFRFIDHIKVHICPEDIKCEICGKQLRSKRGIRSHMKNVHSEKVNKFNCDQCNGIFSTKGSLARHKLLHIPEDKWTFTCDECGKCFPTEGVLRTHINTIHESRYGGICDLCGKKYQSPQDLKRHRLEHDGVRQPKAQCEICGDWVSNKYKLKRHMVIHMTGDFKCNLCNKIAPNELALKSHIRYTHMKQRTHQCNICDKVFRRTLDLKEHMTVHTGEALYVCPHCPRTFTHHSNMHHHRKKMHRKEFDEERKNRGVRQISWNKETELKKPTTIAKDELLDNQYQD